MQETTTNTTTASTPAAPRTDRLELTKELGRGSIGIVHKARNSQSGRVIALRQFEVPQWLDDVNDLLNRILAEAKGASALEHDGIGRLYTCGYKGFTVFLTSEFVDGETLKSVMASRTIELPEVLNIARQLCEALDYAHGRGVFHHFLTPSNIKVTPEGGLKILDFGLLRDKHLLSQTPAKKLENEPYLSPEMVRNKLPDRAANLFSLATIIYELYTTRNPFAGMHLGEVDRAITDITPHALNIANTRVHPATSAVVLKALSKNPADRYLSGREFLTALEEASRAEPVKQVIALQTDARNGAGETSHVFGEEYSPQPEVTAAVAPEPHVIGPPPRNARVQVAGANKWKLLGAVAACLFVVGLLAFMFKKRPTEVVETPGPQPVAVATATPAPIVIPTPEPEAALPEATAEETQPTVESTISKIRTRKKERAARAAAAAAVPVTQGQVTVSSMPADATIEIEGVNGQWRTPHTLKALDAGSYKLSTTKPGYAPDVRNVQVDAGGHTVVDVRLTAVKGFLNVGGTPSGATILVNGRDTGRVTPAALMLDPATHNVVLRKAGYLDSTMEIQLVAGQTVTYTPSMLVAGRTDNIKVVGGGVGGKVGIGKIFGGGGSGGGKARIEIKTEPKGAQVIVNGTELQKSTPLEIQVEAGNYEITLRKDGYKPVHESAIVGADDRVKIEKSLNR